MRVTYRYQVTRQLPSRGRSYPALTNQTFVREYIRIGDDPPIEPQDVLWLQTSEWYADIRLRRDGSGFSSMVGRAEWNAPFLTFHHDIDLASGFPEDIGKIRLTAYGCLEFGEFQREGKAINFEEKWLSAAHIQNSRVFACFRSGALAGMEVQLGPHCIIVTRSAAARFEKRGKCWKLVFKSPLFPSFRRPMCQIVKPGWQEVESVTT